MKTNFPTRNSIQDVSPVNSFGLNHSRSRRCLEIGNHSGLAIVLAMGISLAACGGSGSSSAPDPTQPPTQNCEQNPSQDMCQTSAPAPTAKTTAAPTPTSDPRITGEMENATPAPPSASETKTFSFTGDQLKSGAQTLTSTAEPTQPKMIVAQFGAQGTVDSITTAANSEHGLHILATSVADSVERLRVTVSAKISTTGKSADAVHVACPAQGSALKMTVANTFEAFGNEGTGLFVGNCGYVHIHVLESSSIRALGSLSRAISIEGLRSLEGYANAVFIENDGRIEAAGKTASHGIFVFGYENSDSDTHDPRPIVVNNRGTIAKSFVSRSGSAIFISKNAIIGNHGTIEGSIVAPGGKYLASPTSKTWLDIPNEGAAPPDTTNPRTSLDDNYQAPPLQLSNGMADFKAGAEIVARVPQAVWHKGVGTLAGKDVSVTLPEGQSIGTEGYVLGKLNAERGSTNYKDRHVPDALKPLGYLQDDNGLRVFWSASRFQCNDGTMEYFSESKGCFVSKAGFSGQTTSETRSISTTFDEGDVFDTPNIFIVNVGKPAIDKDSRYSIGSSFSPVDGSGLKISFPNAIFAQNSPVKKVVVNQYADIFSRAAGRSPHDPAIRIDSSGPVVLANEGNIVVDVSGNEKAHSLAPVQNEGGILVSGGADVFVHNKGQIDLSSLKKSTAIHATSTGLSDVNIFNSGDIFIESKVHTGDGFRNTLFDFADDTFLANRGLTSEIVGIADDKFAVGQSRIVNSGDISFNYGGGVGISQTIEAVSGKAEVVNFGTISFSASSRPGADENTPVEFNPSEKNAIGIASIVKSPDQTLSPPPQGVLNSVVKIVNKGTIQFQNVNFLAGIFAHSVVKKDRSTSRRFHLINSGDMLISNLEPTKETPGFGSMEWQGIFYYQDGEPSEATDSVTLENRGLIELEASRGNTTGYSNHAMFVRIENNQNLQGTMRNSGTIKLVSPSASVFKRSFSAMEFVGSSGLNKINLINEKSGKILLAGDQHAAFRVSTYSKNDSEFKLSNFGLILRTQNSSEFDDPGSDLSFDYESFRYYTGLAHLETHRRESTSTLTNNKSGRMINTSLGYAAVTDGGTQVVNSGVIVGDIQLKYSGSSFTANAGSQTALSMSPLETDPRSQFAGTVTFKEGAQVFVLADPDILKDGDKTLPEYNGNLLKYTGEGADKITWNVKPEDLHVFGSFDDNYNLIPSPALKATYRNKVNNTVSVSIAPKANTQTTANIAELRRSILDPMAFSTSVKRSLISSRNDLDYHARIKKLLPSEGSTLGLTSANRINSSLSGILVDRSLSSADDTSLVTFLGQDDTTFRMWSAQIDGTRVSDSRSNALEAFAGVSASQTGFVTGADLNLTSSLQAGAILSTAQDLATESGVRNGATIDSFQSAGGIYGLYRKDGIFAGAQLGASQTWSTARSPYAPLNLELTAESGTRAVSSAFWLGYDFSGSGLSVRPHVMISATSAHQSEHSYRSAEGIFSTVDATSALLSYTRFGLDASARLASGAGYSLDVALDTELDIALTGTDLELSYKLGQNTKVHSFESNPLESWRLSLAPALNYSMSNGFSAGLTMKADLGPSTTRLDSGIQLSYQF